MGVLGFTPFLQKACPDVIKHFPTRLRALSGKKIAVDGNLVTQRLHFGAGSHEHGHIIGWYKMIKDMHANGVGVITVWDGKERSSAKAREQARRQATRLLQLARGAHEQGRLHRLQRLTGAVKKYQHLCRAEQLQVSAAVRLAVGAAAVAQLHGLADVMEKVHSSKSIKLANEIVNDTELDYAEADRALQKEMLLHLYSHEEREALASFLDHVDPEDVTTVAAVDTAYESVLEALANASEADERPADAKWFDMSADDMGAYRFGGREKDPKPEVIPEPHTTLGLSSSYPAPITSLQYPGFSPDTITKELTELYQDFRETTLKNSPELSTSLPEVMPTLPLAVIEPEHVLPSKYQAQLTADEQLFWKRLIVEVAEGSVEGVPKSDDVADVALLENLFNRSGQMALSYEKRNRQPTAATYAESRRILSAMGVPCIEAEYPYEAEALAASLVINGLANYVGSEDTDVLIYEAPLLRNLTNRQLPLALISGTDVRNALQLSRESFVDFALLLGTDFTQRVKNLGPHTAIKLIRTYGSIEQLLRSQTKYVPSSPGVYMEQIEVARLVFSTLPPVPDSAPFQEGIYDEQEVQALLKEYHVQVADLAEDMGDHTAHDGHLGANYFGDNPVDPSGTYWSYGTIIL
ncbi:PIN domain-like protein [Dacryopinax primogenitus]|uniref:PIN domain-like protein n=1 Tax=Dacryopinax primogenitus (strain DJM 731) TaxID=1858805 RepID=M5G2A7_DACPD|nr:PIN domain-like protein [Dacryopinax primogenitus]EJU02350.1 PIN domain-like protein [Dacryopinax primogenitus]